MLLDTFEEGVDVFPDVLGGVLFDDFLESGFGVGTVCGDFAGSCGFEQTFDSLEVILRVNVNQFGVYVG